MILVSICLVLAGVLIPVAAKLPKLVEAEIVLGSFWLVWVIALTWLLFRGHKVEDDAFWTGLGAKGRKSMMDRWNGCGDIASGCGDPGCLFFDEGCASILLVIVAFLLIGLAFLLLIELIVPAIALLLLASIGGMFARAVNDNHHCDGRFGLSLFWGAIWATVYIGPVAAIVIWVISLLPKIS